MGELPAPVRDISAVSGALLRYWLTIRPEVAPELRRCRRWAEAIPDPTLRRQALLTLGKEVLNVEGVAVFAILVPAPLRSRATRLMAVLQVICDYLDTIGEEPFADTVENGVQLHRALGAALQPDGAPIDYYRYHPRKDDGGYLERLVDRCRECLRGFPALGAVLPSALRAAQRCGEAQGHTHAAIRGGTGELADWSLRQDRAEGYRWWELAAGGISTLSLYAQLAAAADPNTSGADAEQIDAAYFPPVCAFSALLDSLVDYDEDSGVASHSSVGLYADDLEAAERIAFVGREAERLVRALPNGRRHAAILAGLAGFNLSAAGSETAFAKPVKARVAEELGPMVPPIMATMRVRRWIRRRRRSEQPA